MIGRSRILSIAVTIGLLGIQTAAVAQSRSATFDNKKDETRDAPGDFRVVKIDRYSQNIRIRARGTISIGKIDGRSHDIELEAGRDVVFNKKIDGRSHNIKIMAGGSVRIGDKIAGSSKRIFIRAGKNVDIRNEINGGSEVTICAGGPITIGNKIDGRSTVRYVGELRVPSVLGGSQVIRLASCP